jgi:hypothetical protein
VIKSHTDNGHTQKENKKGHTEENDYAHIDLDPSLYSVICLTTQEAMANPNAPVTNPAVP